VIASRADFDRALRMRRPPDLFELRLDCMAGIADRLQPLFSKLRAPLIITARHPKEGGAGKLSMRQRRDLLTRFLNHADYLDVELRSASELRSLLAAAESKKKRRIISFHDLKCTPSTRLLTMKARQAKAHGADVFKVATRINTPVELGQLLEFVTYNRTRIPLAVMGIGRLGALSRVLLARAGSVLIYASLSATVTEGQLSVEELRALGIGRMTTLC
jgi:3-dehydroquinate dehydratase-1